MKRTPFKRKPPKYSNEYGKVIREMGQTGICQGCDQNKPVTNSHLIPRSKNEELITSKENIHRHCHECADKCETGKYEQLSDGKQIVGYIQTMDPDYLALKNLKFEARLGQSIYDYFKLNENE